MIFTFPVPYLTRSQVQARLRLYSSTLYIGEVGQADPDLQEPLSQSLLLPRNVPRAKGP